MKSNLWSVGLVAVLAIAACSKDDPLLQGKREGLREVLDTDVARAAAPQAAENTRPPLALPPARENADWLQRIGSPATRITHPALAPSPQLAWSADIGAGDGKKARITADPVVAGGRVFTLDAVAQVSAVSARDGSVLWTVDMMPPDDRSTSASGGGLAFGDGRLFVSSGFGLLTALDPETGQTLWQQKLRATGSGSPAVHDGRVYLVAGSEVAWVLDAATGRIDWQLSATPAINNVMGGPAPAITGKYAVFGFGSGEVQGAFRQGGLRLWDAQVAGQRPGESGARITDITGDPVVVDDVIYTGSHSGRTVALGLANGERLWTANEGPLNPIWPAGDSLFLVSDRNELLRLSARDGQRIWGHDLPLFTKSRPKRQTEIVAHHGPVIAGGQLIVASNDGLLRFFDPVSGTATATVDMPDGATTNPVVAGRTLYVVSTRGQLLAFR